MRIEVSQPGRRIRRWSAADRNLGPSNREHQYRKTAICRIWPNMEGGCSGGRLESDTQVDGGFVGVQDDPVSGGYWRAVVRFGFRPFFVLY